MFGLARFRANKTKMKMSTRLTNSQRFFAANEAQSNEQQQQQQQHKTAIIIYEHQIQQERNNDHFTSIVQPPYRFDGAFDCNIGLILSWICARFAIGINPTHNHVSWPFDHVYYGYYSRF